jgi:hypothetical protein
MKGTPTMPVTGLDLNWWVSVFEIPLLAALFKLMWDIKRELSQKIEHMDQRHAESTSRLRDDLAAFKLEVARSYVPMQMMRETDRRLSIQLLRIEEKLDAVTPRSRPRYPAGEDFHG